MRRSWSRLLNGDCGVVSVSDRSAQFAALPSRVAGCVPRGKTEEGEWDAPSYLDIIVRLSLILDVFDAFFVEAFLA